MNMKDLSQSKAKIFNPISYIAAGGFMGILGLAIYSTGISGGKASGWSIFGVGLSLAAAATAIGSLLGFLFAIPRSSDGGQKTEDSTGYRANTNLEQVSDWLTKIIVGVGLVEIGRAGPSILSLIHAIGKGMGDSAGANTVGAALGAFFLVLGFLTCYLWTTTRLTQELRHIYISDLAQEIAPLVSGIQSTTEPEARQESPQDEGPSTS